MPPALSVDAVTPPGLNALAPLGAGANAALAYARAAPQRARWLRALCDFIALPSVSAAPERAPLARCADWLAAHCRSVGLTDAHVAGGRYPAVIARHDGKPGAPRVLAYGHFDVQPPGPGWSTDPFSPVVRDGALFGRGASDDKGQFFMHLAAIESLFAAGLAPRLNLRLWCEGEEELGSPGAPFFLDRHLPELAADVAVVSDTEMPSPRQPALIYGLRGMVVLDVEVRGPRRALHAGRFGGAAGNPIEALAALVASLHDRRRRVAVDGFFTGVREVGAAERRALATASARGPRPPPKNAALPEGFGEPGFTVFERTTIRPAIVVTAIDGGSGGASIPAAARARITARLVPRQEPLAVARAIRAHVLARLPPDMRCIVRLRGATPAVRLPVRAPAMRIAADALRATYGVDPVLLRSGGSIPIVGQLHRRLRAPVVVMGFGLPSDAIHGPDERLMLDQFFAGVETLIRFYAAFAR